MNEKIIGASFLAAAGLIAWVSLNPDLKLPSFGPQTFSSMVSEEFSLMRAKRILPKEWDSIQYVTYNFNSEFQKKLVNNRKIEIKDSPTGKHRLEIDFIDVPDEENPAIILQMSLFELESKNKIWELGKTYPISQFLKQGKSSATAASEEKMKAPNEAQKKAEELKAEAKNSQANTQEAKSAPSDSSPSR